MLKPRKCECATGHITYRNAAGALCKAPVHYLCEQHRAEARKRRAVVSRLFASFGRFPVALPEPHAHTANCCDGQV